MPTGSVHSRSGALLALAGRLGWRLNIILFLLTLLTTTVCGAVFFAEESPHDSFTAFLGQGLRYAIPVLLILGSHEMGHYGLCRYYRVEATLPYFLPAPFLFGTFGAVIRMRHVPRESRGLFDIGIAGPLAGFAVAVPFVVYGIATARVEPFPAGGGEYLVFGDPPLVHWLAAAFHGPIPEGSVMIGNPVLSAGWLGLLVTAMNLFPVGQLDGGHIAFAVSPRLHRILSRVTVAAMLSLVAATMVSQAMQSWSAGEGRGRSAGLAGGVLAALVYGLYFRLPAGLRKLTLVMAAALAAAFVWEGFFSPWLLWTVVLALLGRHPHPPVGGPSAPVGGPRLALAALALLIFIVCFIPVPLTTTTAPA